MYPRRRICILWAYILNLVHCYHGVPKPSKPAKIMSTGAVVNFSIFYTAEFRSQIRPIQDTLQPRVVFFKNLILKFSFLNCLDIISLY